MLNPLNNAAIFLITVLFDTYLLVLMVRLILAWNRANYFNPITQVVIKLTQPVVVPLRSVLPNYRGLEISTLIIIFALVMVKFLLVGLVTFGMPNVVGLLILAAADTLKLFLNTLFYAILLQAVLSWIQQAPSALSQLLMLITTPILRPIQRFAPIIGGLDFSPLIALILLQLLIILLVNPLVTLGMGVSFA